MAVSTVEFKSGGVNCVADLYRPKGLKRGMRRPAKAPS